MTAFDSALAILWLEDRRASLAALLDEARISSLFKRSSPSAIARFVVSVWVDAIERESFWARTHVSEERGEAVAPPKAHGDSARPIDPVLSVGDTEASGLGMVPRAIFARGVCVSTSPTGMAMGDRPLAESFDAKTAAALRPAINQRIANYIRAVTARAETSPRYASALVLRSVENLQSSELPPRQRAHSQLHKDTTLGLPCHGF